MNETISNDGDFIYKGYKIHYYPLTHYGILKGYHAHIYAGHDIDLNYFNWIWNTAYRDDCPEWGWSKEEVTELAKQEIDKEGNSIYWTSKQL